MKKILVLLTLLLILNLNDVPRVESVFGENFIQTNFYEITFLNNISTNNFLEYFNNIKVIWIKPKMNLLYSDKLNKFNKYYFKEISNSKNISNFMNRYLKSLDSLGYKNEVLKLKTSGIMLDKVKVYLTDDELYNLKIILKDIKIENVV